MGYDYYNPRASYGYTEQNIYEQGFEKGQMHSEDGIPQRYKYVEKAKSTSAWPNPIGQRG